MVEEILKEFEEKFPIEESSDFSTCKVRREFTFTGNIAFWLKEKLTAFEKKTKEEFLKRILPEKTEWVGGWNDCIGIVEEKANKEGINIK